MRSRITSKRARSMPPVLKPSKEGMTSGRHDRRVEVAARGDPGRLLEQRDVVGEELEGPSQQRLAALTVDEHAQALDRARRPLFEVALAQLPRRGMVEPDQRIQRLAAAG